MTFDTFADKFSTLSNDEKIAIYHTYQVETQQDGVIEDFDDEFFNIYFSSPMEAARATYFGHIESWSDEYIRFNAYGNLESLSEYEVLGEIENELEEIFDCEIAWSYYIEDDEDEDED